MQLERDKGYGLFAQRSRDDVKEAFTQHALGQNDDILRRKVQLLLQPGDVLLDTDQWMRVRVTSNKLYQCEPNRPS